MNSIAEIYKIWLCLLFDIIYADLSVRNFISLLHYTFGFDLQSLPYLTSDNRNNQLEILNTEICLIKIF